MLTRWLACARGIARRRRIDTEIDEELAFHLQQETEANIARGLAPEAARRAALLSLGGVTQTDRVGPRRTRARARRGLARHSPRAAIAARRAGVHARRAPRPDAEHRRRRDDLLDRRRRGAAPAALPRRGPAGFGRRTEHDEVGARACTWPRHRTSCDWRAQQTVLHGAGGHRLRQHQRHDPNGIRNRRRWRRRR